MPATTVVMLTVSRDDDDLFAALQAGAPGYLLKDMDPARLADALHGVCAGEAALSRTLVGRVIGELPEILATAQGRRGWLRAAAQRLEQPRADEARPIPRSRGEPRSWRPSTRLSPR